MDLVDYDRGGLRPRSRTSSATSRRSSRSPTSRSSRSRALHGDNVVDRSRRTCPGTSGPPLLYHLEHVHIASDRNLIDARFPVQWVIRRRPTSTTTTAATPGQVAGGVLRPGDEVVRAARRARTSRSRASTPSTARSSEAFPPMSVTIRLEDDLDVSRGDMICRAAQPARRSRASSTPIVCWMSERAAARGRALRAQAHDAHGARGRRRAALPDRRQHAAPRRHGAPSSGSTTSAACGLRTSAPLVFDPYRRNRATGRVHPHRRGHQRHRRRRHDHRPDCRD